MAKIVVFGVSNWAELAHFYLTHDSPHEVVAFTLDRSHMSTGEYKGLSVIPFDEVEGHYPPDRFKMFIPMSFKKMNHVRAAKYKEAMTSGVRCETASLLFPFAAQQINAGAQIGVLHPERVTAV